MYLYLYGPSIRELQYARYAIEKVRTLQELAILEKQIDPVALDRVGGLLRRLLNKKLDEFIAAEC